MLPLSFCTTQLFPSSVQTVQVMYNRWPLNLYRELQQTDCHYMLSTYCVHVVPRVQAVVPVCGMLQLAYLAL